MPLATLATCSSGPWGRPSSRCLGPPAPLWTGMLPADAPTPSSPALLRAAGVPQCPPPFTPQTQPQRLHVLKICGFFFLGGGGEQLSFF